MANNISTATLTQESTTLLYEFTQSLKTVMQGAATVNCSMSANNLTNYSMPFDTDACIEAKQNTTNITDEVSLHILYTPPDLVMMLLYLWITIPLTLYGSSLLIYIIIKHEEFQEPHYYFMASYIVGDIFRAVGKSVPALIILMTGSKVGGWFCFSLGQIPQLGLYTISHSIGVIALERYYYFCNPFKFDRIFSHTKSAFMIGILWLFDIALIILLDFAVEQKNFYYNILNCRREGENIIVTV